MTKLQQRCIRCRVSHRPGNIDLHAASRRLLSRDERAELIEILARAPFSGDVIQGLGGVRKLRFAPQGRGKSGAFRVVYYVLTRGQPVLALLIYGKNEQGDLSPAQRKAVAALAAEMKRPS